MRTSIPPRSRPNSPMGSFAGSSGTPPLAPSHSSSAQRHSQPQPPIGNGARASSPEFGGSADPSSAAFFAATQRRGLTAPSASDAMAGDGPFSPPPSQQQSAGVVPPTPHMRARTLSPQKADSEVERDRAEAEMRAAAGASPRSLGYSSTTVAEPLAARFGFNPARHAQLRESQLRAVAAATAAASSASAAAPPSTLDASSVSTTTVASSQAPNTRHRVNGHRPSQTLGHQQQQQQRVPSPQRGAQAAAAESSSAAGANAVVQRGPTPSGMNDSRPTSALRGEQHHQSVHVPAGGPRVLQRSNSPTTRPPPLHGGSSPYGSRSSSVGGRPPPIAPHVAQRATPTRSASVHADSIPAASATVAAGAGGAAGGTPSQSPSRSPRRVIVAVPVGRRGTSPPKRGGLTAPEPAVVLAAAQREGSAPRHGPMAHSPNAATTPPSPMFEDASSPAPKAASPRSVRNTGATANLGGAPSSPSASAAAPSSASPHAPSSDEAQRYHAMYREQVRSARLWRDRAAELEAQGLQLLEEKTALAAERDGLLADVKALTEALSTQQQQQHRGDVSTVSSRHMSPPRDEGTSNLAAHLASRGHRHTNKGGGGGDAAADRSTAVAPLSVPTAQEAEALVFAHLRSLADGARARDSEEVAYIKALAEEERRSTADLFTSVAAMLDVAEGPATGAAGDGDTAGPREAQWVADEERERLQRSRREQLIAALSAAASSTGEGSAQTQNSAIPLPLLFDAGPRLAAYSDLLEDCHAYVLACKLQTAGAMQTAASVRDVLGEVVEALHASAKMLFTGNRRAAGARRSLGAAMGAADFGDATTAEMDGAASDDGYGTEDRVLGYVRSQQQLAKFRSSNGAANRFVRGTLEEPAGHSPHSSRRDRSASATGGGSGGSPMNSGGSARAHITSAAQSLAAVEQKTEEASDVLRGCVQGVKAVLLSLEESSARSRGGTASFATLPLAPGGGDQSFGPFGRDGLRPAAQDILDEIQKDIVAFKRNSAATVRRVTQRLARSQEAHRKDCESYRGRLLAAEREYTRLLLATQQLAARGGGGGGSNGDASATPYQLQNAFAVEHLRSAYYKAVGGAASAAVGQLRPFAAADPAMAAPPTALPAAPHYHYYPLLAPSASGASGSPSFHMTPAPHQPLPTSVFTANTPLPIPPPPPALRPITATAIDVKPQPQSFADPNSIEALAAKDERYANEGGRSSIGGGLRSGRGSTSPHRDSAFAVAAAPPAAKKSVVPRAHSAASAYRGGGGGRAGGGGADDMARFDPIFKSAASQQGPQRGHAAHGAVASAAGSHANSRANSPAPVGPQQNHSHYNNSMYQHQGSAAPAHVATPLPHGHYAAASPSPIFALPPQPTPHPRSSSHSQLYHGVPPPSAAAQELASILGIQTTDAVFPAAAAAVAGRATATPHRYAAQPTATVPHHQYSAHATAGYGGLAPSPSPYATPLGSRAQSLDPQHSYSHGHGHGVAAGVKGPAEVGGLAAMRQRLLQQRAIIGERRHAAALASGHRSVSQTIVSPSEYDD